MKNVVPQTSAKEATVEKSTTAVAVANKDNSVSTEGAMSTMDYAKMVFANAKKEFVEANEGMDLDFVFLGDWLSINKKGQFYEKSNLEVNYGDSIEVLVASGEERFTVWGKKDSKNDGELIVSDKSQENAIKMLQDFVDANPSEAKFYSETDVQSRYLAFVIPTKSIKEGSPKIYMLSLSATAKFAFGRYTRNLFQGYYAANGVLKGTGVSKVITKIVSVEKTRDANTSYVTMDFSAVGMFTV